MLGVTPLGLIFGPRQLNRFLPPSYATMSLNTRGIIMFATINQFFTTFGAPVMVPVLLLIIARSLRVPWGQAAQSALAAGVGLTGFSWLISAFTPLVTKLIHQLVNSAGIQRPVVDLGWQTGSLAAFSAPVGLAVFGFSLLLELLLFALGYTRIFMPANLWNNFGFML